MLVVLDCSIVLAGELPDEISDIADAVMEHMGNGTINIVVPPHFMIECANGLVMAKRLKRVSAEDMQTKISQWQEVPLEVDYRSDIMQIVKLAETHGLTIYDAAYLELALRRKAKLATLDAALVKAAKKEKVWLKV